MTQVSRRQFLQLAGITVLGHSVGFEITDPLESYYGRALEAAPVFRQPRPDAAQVTSLWPDSVVAITPAKGPWYHASEGYVPWAYLQPIRHQPSYPVQRPPSLPFWAEVRAPVAVIRQWCAPEAPLVTRIGYGGVMHVVDYLPGATDWFGVANADGTFTGWSQALHWQTITARWQPLSALNIELDQGQRKI